MTLTLHARGLSLFCQFRDITDEKSRLDAARKHAPPRPTTPTVSTLEDYCQAYRDCFPDVRAFERFESLLLGLLY